MAYLAKTIFFHGLSGVDKVKVKDEQFQQGEEEEATTKTSTLAEDTLCDTRYVHSVQCFDNKVDIETVPGQLVHRNEPSVIYSYSGSPGPFNNNNMHYNSSLVTNMKTEGNIEYNTYSPLIQSDQNNNAVSDATLPSMSSCTNNGFVGDDGQSQRLALSVAVDSTQEELKNATSATLQPKESKSREKQKQLYKDSSPNIAKEEPRKIENLIKVSQDTPPRYQCTVCDKSYSTRSHAKGHLVKKHFPDTKLKEYRCKYCSTVFTRKRECDEHRRICRKTQYKCDQCDETFSAKSYFTSHLRAHARAKKYRCDICRETFSTKAHLTKHYHVECQVCCAKFAWTNDLIDHMKTHIHGDKPFVCTCCLKTFVYRHEMERHYLLHCGLKPYNCTERKCNKTFEKKVRLRQHMFVHTRPFECYVCGKKFPQRSHCKKHSKICSLKNDQITNNKRYLLHLNSYTWELKDNLPDITACEEVYYSTRIGIKEEEEEALFAGHNAIQSWYQQQCNNETSDQEQQQEQQEEEQLKQQQQQQQQQ